jgi:hypothetical protein
MNFNFHVPAMFVFLVFHKNGLTENCLPFEDQRTEFHGPMLTGASFAFMSEV